MHKRFLAKTIVEHHSEHHCNSPVFTVDTDFANCSLLQLEHLKHRTFSGTVTVNPQLMHFVSILMLTDSISGQHKRDMFGMSTFFKSGKITLSPMTSSITD